MCRVIWCKPALAAVYEYVSVLTAPKPLTDPMLITLLGLEVDTFAVNNGKHLLYVCISTMWIKHGNLFL